MDECIESIQSIDDLINFIRQDPVYRTIYLFCSENEWLDRLKYSRLSSKYLVPLPKYQRDVNFPSFFSSDRIDEVIKEVENKVTGGNVMRYISITSDKRATRYDYDTYLPDVNVPIPAIFYIFFRKYLRLLHNSMFDNTIHRDGYHLACFILYAWYTDNYIIISIVLDIDPTLEFLSLMPGNLCHVIRRDLCYPSMQVAKFISKSLISVSLGTFVKNDLAIRMLTDKQFLSLCYCHDIYLTMRHLNYALMKVYKEDKKFDHIDPSDVDLEPCTKNYCNQFDPTQIRTTPYLFHYALGFYGDFRHWIAERYRGYKMIR